MNAGGKVTVRSYRLDPVNGTFRVSAAEEMPAAEPKAAAGGRVVCCAGCGIRRDRSAVDDDCG